MIMAPMHALCMLLKLVVIGDNPPLACRALADQLEGDQEEHEKYRSMVVNYIKVCVLIVHIFLNSGLCFSFVWLYLCMFYAWLL